MERQQIAPTAGGPVSIGDIPGLPSELDAKADLVNTDGSPGRTIFVGATPPASPAEGDVWITPAG
mgnify:CR=1 FL=1